MECPNLGCPPPSITNFHLEGNHALSQSSRPTANNASVRSTEKLLQKAEGEGVQPNLRGLAPV
jgi:hypothetical protein